MKLSILISTIQVRQHELNSLLTSLETQICKYENEIEVLLQSDNGEASIGAKRNLLLSKANGDYVCFIDDDDEVSEHYVDYIMEGISKAPDCCSLRGVITWDGENPELFEHSIRYKAYATTTNDIKYERYPNHLNCIKASIAKQFKFPETNHGEDTEWATQIFNSGLIKTEYFIDRIIYHYKFITNK